MEDHIQLLFHAFLVRVHRYPPECRAGRGNHLSVVAPKKQMGRYRYTITRDHVIYVGQAMVLGIEAL